MNTSTNQFQTVMKTTALVTAIVTGMLFVLSCLFDWKWILPTAISFGTTCYHCSMRLLVGWIVPFTAKSVDQNCWWFRPHHWEPAFYAVLKVKNWKRNLPTYAPEQFDLKTNTLRQVIHNTCNAELVHEVIIVFSFLPLTFSIWFGEFPIFMITSLAAALFDSIFVIAQRYNRPRLMRILEKTETE